MSSKEQNCATESKSTVFHNFWQILQFNSTEGQQWKSDMFYGYSSHSSGCEVAWQYVLVVNKSERTYCNRRGINIMGYSVTFSTLIDSCDASLNVEVDLDNGNKITGLTKPGSTLGQLTLASEVLKNCYLRNDTLTFRLKFSLIEDPVPEDSQLVENFLSLLSNETLSDVTIQVGSEKFYAQKAILSVRSPVFAAMFQSGMQESTQNRLTVDDIKPEVFKEMLRYVYVGKVERLKEMPHELLVAADKYALDRLRKICENHLLGHINKDTVLKTLALADLHHADELKKQSIQFICKNIKSMQGTDWMDYNGAHPDLVAAILSAMTMTEI